MANEDRDSRRSAGGRHSTSDTSNQEEKLNSKVHTTLQSEKACRCSSTVAHDRLIPLLSNPFWSFCKSTAKLTRGTQTSLTRCFFKMIDFRPSHQTGLSIPSPAKPPLMRPLVLFQLKRVCLVWKGLARMVVLNAAGVDEIGFEISQSGVDGCWRRSARARAASD